MMNNETFKKYEAVIGLEIHAELKTKRKMFCGCANDPFHAKPNENVCPVCLGMPGALPVLNRQAIEWTILTGLALNCKVNEFSKWDRKNYFYPDLPKGYQISQYDLPLVYEGYLEIQNNKKIRITRIHLEEDTGTSKHPEGRADVDYSLLDYNRSGVPLMELVTEPDIASGEEAKEFCKNYQLILRTLGIADGDMEKGQMRCEANISVRIKGEKALGTKVEVKNLNSFKSVQKAIEYEIERQIKAIESKEKIIQETRGWNEQKNQTYVMRVKETSADYRYFPEPDLPPVQIVNVMSKDENDKVKLQNVIFIEEIKKQLPEMPQDKITRFEKEYYLDVKVAKIIISNIELLKYFELCLDEIEKLNIREKNKRNALIINCALIIVNNPFLLPENQKFLIELADLQYDGKISGKIAKEILPEMKKGKSPIEIVKEKGLEQVSDTGEIEKIVDMIIVNNADAVAKIKAGQTGVIGFLVGQIMKETRGKANPQVVNELLSTKLK